MVQGENLQSAVQRMRTHLRNLPSSQLMGGNYTCPWVCRTYLLSRGIDILSQSTTVEQFLACFPDKCSWLSKLSVGPDERICDLCHRLGYTANAQFLSATTCLLDDSRLLQLLPPRADLTIHLRTHLDELLVAHDAYTALHGLSPCPAVLFEEVFGRKKQKNLSQEALATAASRRASCMAALPSPKMTQALQACPHEPRVSRLVQLGMAVAQLASHEALIIVAVATKLLGRCGQAWSLDDGAEHAALLHLAAKFEWSAPSDACDTTIAMSPDSRISYDIWKRAVATATGVPSMAACVAEHRIMMTLGRSL